MSKATFYIEYLVVGAFAMVAFLVASGLHGGDMPSAATLAVSLPLAYVAGLFIEALGVIPEDIYRWFAHERTMCKRVQRGWRKRRRAARVPRKGLRAPARINLRQRPSRTMAIIAWNNSVAAELSLRRSRDRIARGAMVTLFVLTLYALIGVARPEMSHVAASLARHWILLSLALILMTVTWVVLHRNTRKFKQTAYVAARKAELAARANPVGPAS